MFIQANKKQHGYSLLEMLIALAIIASLVSLAAVSIRPSSGPAAIRSDAHEIAAGLRRVRTHAIATGDSAEFQLNLRTREQKVLDKNRALRRDIDIRATVAESLRQENGVVGVLFHPNGSSTGGKFELSIGAAATIVYVDWMTGRVRIEEASDVL